MFSPEIQSYIKCLTEKSPDITSIWLLGSRVNGNATANSDWDLLVFGDTSTFNIVKEDRTLHSEEIDLLVVVRDEFFKPYGNPKSGSLTEWEWNIKSENEATYRGIKWIPDTEAESDGMDNMGQMCEKTLRAVKVY